MTTKHAATNLISLSYPVCTSLGLQVILGVPVWVKNDDRVSCGKINTQAASTSGQQETEVLQGNYKNQLLVQQ